MNKSTTPLPMCSLRFESHDEEHAVPHFVVEGQPPLAMPQIPQSLFDWCDSLCAAMWRGHRRCLALLLLFDRRQRQWTARVPYQQCMPEGVCWRPELPASQPAGPTDVLAGTMQICTASQEEEVRALIPPFDGVHLIQQITSRQRRVHAILRVDDTCSTIPLDLILRDDWQQMLTDAEQVVIQ